MKLSLLDLWIISVGKEQTNATLGDFHFYARFFSMIGSASQQSRVDGLMFRTIEQFRYVERCALENFLKVERSNLLVTLLLVTNIFQTFLFNTKLVQI